MYHDLGYRLGHSTCKKMVVLPGSLRWNAARTPDPTPVLAVERLACMSLALEARRGLACLVEVAS